MQRYKILGILILFVLIYACRREDNFITDNDAKLTFSTDTLRFDTVFTSLGSATRYFKVRNPHSKSIKISKISLEGIAGATFNLNIDGVSGRSFTDVEIPAKDSIYVFAEVTINPNAPLSISPFVISENLIFETNGNKQKVVLEAWGQNANYIPNRFSNGQLAILSAGGATVTWNDPKPYVIYGVLFLDSVTLNIAAGTRIYIHGGIAQPNDSTAYRDGILYVTANARVNMQGTLERPVIVQGDRLEKEFENEPDQWAGIILGAGSTGNAMTHTIIRNSRIGVRVDSAADLTIKNSKIYNTASSGLLGVHSTVNAENCLFYNNSGNNVQIEFGGNYTFNYCTMASYGSREAAIAMNNIRCYERSGINCISAKTYPLSIRLTNSIFYGSKDDEISLYDATKTGANDFDVLFKNCIVRVKDLLKTENYPNFLTQNCQNCQNAAATVRLFKKISEQNFKLDSLSVADGKAIVLPNITTDIENKIRSVSTPDIGCYEKE